MKPIEYLLMQFELEGIQRVSSDLITRASQNVDDFPLVLSARTSDRENLICFDELLSEETCNKLPKDDLQEFKTEAALEVLKNSGIQVKVSHFKTYIFPESFQFASVETVKCFSQEDSRIIAFGFHGLADKVFAIENEGVILSACVSARQNSRAAEAWVFTHSDYRQKGLAQQVVTAWAKNTLQEGLTPFYSHNVENTNSARLAKRLNLIQVFEEIVIEKVP